MNRTNRRIVTKLETLRASDPEFRWFGVDTHRYRLGPCLSSQVIQRVEKRYPIHLPRDYRSFLLEVGNGGVGPGYGLQRFGFVGSPSEIPTAKAKGSYRTVQKSTTGETLQRQNLYDASGKKVDPFDISFFNSIRTFAPDGELGAEAAGKPFPLDAPVREEVHVWDGWAQLDPNIGTWTLADYGCAMTAHLVLNGPFRGQVWFYDPNCIGFMPFGEKAFIHCCFDEKGPYEPTEEQVKTTFTFCTWYEHWLDNAFEHVRREYETIT